MSVRSLILSLGCALTVVLSTVTGVVQGAQNDASAAIANFQAAFQGQDNVAKRDALQTLADRSVGSDDVVLPLLVQALGDRQAGDDAIAALRRRTGLMPAAQEGVGGYPGYPPGDSPAAWQTWLTARTAAREQQKKVDAALKLATQAKDKEDKGKGKDDGKSSASTGKPATGDGSAPVSAAPVRVPPPEDAKLARIIFKNGDSLLCYILDKQVDGDGHVTGVRIEHPEDGGEEVLSSDLIARIEEDIK